MSTRLLISVRSIDEAAMVARVARLNNINLVIDLKEPAHGPLAPVDDSIVRQVVGLLGHHFTLSAAAGELSDAPDPTRWAASGLTYVKIGLSDATEDWPTKLAEFAQAVGPVRFIVAAYADAKRARSPDPMELVDWVSANRETVAGLLIDTAIKDGPGLLHWLDIARLKAIRKQLDDTGQWLALAGSLTLADIPAVMSIGPNLLAVRSAACHQGDRRSDIDPHAVERLGRLIGSPIASSARREG